MGIRLKIMIGFMSLAALLLFSGVISYFELSSLSRTTSQVLDKSARNIEFSKKMLDAVQDQNTALLHIEVLGINSYDTLLSSGSEKFNEAIKQTGFYVCDLPGLDSIYSARKDYNNVILEHYNDTLSRQQRIEWFVSTYKTSYYHLTQSIKKYMISAQKDMEAQTQALEDNAYRAIMPGIIALVIGIVLILIFFFFIDLYYISPITKTTKALENYINLNIPFNVNFEGRDEIVKLKDQIEQLTVIIKNKKSQ